MQAIAVAVKSRFGTLSVVQHDDVVIGAGFQALDVFIPRVVRHYPQVDIRVVKQAPVSEIAITDIVRTYDDGDVHALASVSVRQPGGQFMQRAWKAMSAIPAGHVMTYAELAKSAGNEAAVRAAGTACSSNLVAPFVPCHRIVKTGGHIGNYGFGVDLKRRLLEHEGASALIR